VDPSQILACGVPMEEIVRGLPYSPLPPQQQPPFSLFPRCIITLTVVNYHLALQILLFSHLFPFEPSVIMYISLLPISLLLSLAAAQTTISGSSTSSTACAAQPVMDSCYASTSAIAQACATTDYACLCSKWNDVLTCACLSCPCLCSLLTI
jgi:hypothetical protein